MEWGIWVDFIFFSDFIHSFIELFGPLDLESPKYEQVLAEGRIPGQTVFSCEILNWPVKIRNWNRMSDIWANFFSFFNFTRSYIGLFGPLNLS